MRMCSIATLREQERSMELRLSGASPLETIALRRQQINSALHSASLGLKNHIQIERGQLNGRTLQLTALSPRETLARGYSIVLVQGGDVVTSASQVKPGDQL